MANRFFQQFRFSMEKYVVELWAQVAIGATGAPTLNAANSKGIASIARTGAGAYTVTLQDTYYRFLDCQAVFVAANPASPVMHVVSENVAAAKTVLLQFRDYAGAATDPGNGDVLRMRFSMSNSSAI